MCSCSTLRWRSDPRRSATASAWFSASPLALRHHLYYMDLVTYRRAQDFWQNADHIIPTLWPNFIWKTENYVKYVPKGTVSPDQICLKIVSLGRASWGHLMLDFTNFNINLIFDKPSKVLSKPLYILTNPLFLWNPANINNTVGIF